MKFIDFRPLFVLISQLTLFAGIAPETTSPPSVVYLIAGENIRVKCVNGSHWPVWSIDNEALINASQILGHNAEVKRWYSSTAGGYLAMLIINDVNSALNGTRISCSSVNETSILSLTLVVGNETTVMSLKMNETFSSGVCTSPSVDSLPPRWLIDGVLLSNISINRMYGAEVRVLGDDHLGRHQSQLLIHFPNTSLNASIISCVVGSELRMQYTLYIHPPDTPAVNETNTTMVVSDATTAASNATGSGGADTTVQIAIGVSMAFLVLLIMTVTVILIAVVLCRSKKIRTLVCQSKIWKALCGRCLNRNGNDSAPTPNHLLVDVERPPDSTPRFSVQENTSPTTPAHLEPTEYVGIGQRRRLFVPIGSFQRDNRIGDAATDEMPIQHVRLHPGSVSLEIDLRNGETAAGGVPEEDQGVEHGAVTVCGHRTFGYQSISSRQSNTPILTKSELLEKGTKIEEEDEL